MASPAVACRGARARSRSRVGDKDERGDKVLSSERLANAAFAVWRRRCIHALAGSGRDDGDSGPGLCRNRGDDCGDGSLKELQRPIDCSGDPKEERGELDGSAPLGFDRDGGSGLGTRMLSVIVLAIRRKLKKISANESRMRFIRIRDSFGLTRI